MSFEDRDPQDRTGEVTPGVPIASPPEMDDRAADLAPHRTVTVVEPATVPADDDEGSEGEGGGSKIKTAAVLAGAAALANKVRQSVPEKVQQVRDKRAAGRHVIISEVDGRYVAIGPYKDEATAQQDAFKVGGTPHVAELISEAVFFSPPS